MDPPGRPPIDSVFVWRLGDGKTRVLLVGLLSFLALMAGFSAGAGLSGRPYGDFFAMWSFARFAMSHPAPQIYDATSLLAFQHSLDPARGFSPFPYPPFYLLFLLPLGLVPIGTGWAIWSAAGLGAYLAAIFAPRWRDGALPFVALAPATLVALATGQNGLFSAALIAGGFRLMSGRPLLAGALFGLAAFKPQLGLLIPVALVAAGAWRCLASASAVVITLSTAATAAFGASVWSAWLGALGRQWADYIAQGNATRMKMPTLAASLESLGASQSLALGLQLTAALAAAVTVWVLFRRRRSDLAVAALVAGCFVATPYALFYDLPLITFALFLAVRETAGAGSRWTLIEVAVLLVACLSPYALFLIGASPFPVGALALALLFVVLARRAFAQPLSP
jgi:hypothetical protein